MNEIPKETQVLEEQTGAAALTDAEIVRILSAIKQKHERRQVTKVWDPLLTELETAFELVMEIKDRNACWKWNWWVRDKVCAALNKITDEKSLKRAVLILRKTYLLGARRENFDDFCVWMEIDRPREKRFYTNRRRYIKPLVQALQDLYDRKIKFLGVSLPPRVGKSTLCKLFLVFVMGHHPESHNLCVGYSTTFINSFMKTTMDFIEGEEYRWKDVFPQLSGITDRSAEMLSFDIKPKPNGMPTCIFRGIDGSLTGIADCTSDGILYCDDLIKGYEEARNMNTLETIWNKYLNQVLDRTHGSMELMVGTRWNVFDPLGRIREKYEDDPQYRFVIIPALNEKDESNFPYEFEGFTTEMYRNYRELLMSGPEWWAKYQGQPYIREGLLFAHDELRTYNGILPEAEPDNIVAAVDVALGGGDSLAMPIGYVYGKKVYIVDVVFNNGTTGVTAPIVAGRLAKHKPYTTQFEENSGGRLYRDVVDNILREQGIRILLTAERAKGELPKRTRIQTYVDDIKHNFIFLDEGSRSKEYRDFMRELCIYTATGKNKHDDAPDSLAQLASMLFVKTEERTFSVARRLF